MEESGWYWVRLSRWEDLLDAARQVPTPACSIHDVGSVSILLAM